jgi:hydrogenase 3 maturation protease
MPPQNRPCRLRNIVGAGLAGEKEIDKGIAGKAGSYRQSQPMPKPDQNLNNLLSGQICIFGFGNRLWRDDGVGSRIAEALQHCENLHAIDGGFVPENYLEKVAQVQPDTILMIDAADFGGQPAEYRLLQADDLAPGSLSTHAGSPRMLAQYLTARTGAKVALLAIQPADTQEGNQLSPEVKATADLLIKQLSNL